MSVTKNTGKVMKKIFLVSAAFIILFSSTGMSAQQNGAPIPMFTVDHDWTWKNLFYGPMEIISTPVYLFVGPVAGVNMGIEYANDETDGIFTRTMKSTGGALGGGLLGLMTAPAILLKGVADTVTGGAFTTGAFF